MEILLNLVWLLLGAAFIALWASFAVKGRTAQISHTQQLFALAVVLVILFPVISLSDDLLIAAQNPAEMYSCVRKGIHSGCPSHQLAATKAPTRDHLLFFEHSLLVQTSDSLQQWVQNPALRRVDNRPPPSA